VRNNPLLLETWMATLVKTPSGRWKAIIRRAGWPLTVKTFRTQRDAGDWARRTEDEMVRGAYIQRASSDRMTVAAAMKRYLTDIVPTKRPTSQATDRRRSKILVKYQPWNVFQGQAR
jgi:ribosomal protein L32